ncbi:MAG: PilZ domain-containing protein [Gammaproteobacteria bacterium]|jgi:hypothetical protein
MEHRRNARTPARLPVIVQVPDLGLIRGRARDFSRRSMYIETAPSVAVWPRSDLRVSVPVGPEVRTLEAVVVRIAGNGFAVCFSDFATPALDSLKALHGESTPPPNTNPAAGGFPVVD